VVKVVYCKLLEKDKDWIYHFIINLVIRSVFDRGFMRKDKINYRFVNKKEIVLDL